MLDVNHHTTQKKIAFLYQNENSWFHLEALYIELKKSAWFDLYIILTPTSLIDTFTTLPVHHFSAQQDISLLDGRTPNVVQNIDAFIFCLPYDNVRPEHLRSTYLSQRGKKIFYVPYAMDLESGFDGIERQFKQPIHQLADAIFTHSPYVKEQFSVHCPRGNQHVHVTGLPRFERMHNSVEPVIPASWLASIQNRLPVLLNSHHSIEYKGASSLFYFWEEAIRFFLHHPEFVCIWRPHPGLFTSLKKSGFMKNHETIQLIDSLEKNGIIVDRTPDFILSFSISRAMITDSSSLIWDYLVLKKPILFQQSPYWQSISNEGTELLDFLPCVQSKHDIGSFIASLTQPILPEKFTVDFQALDIRFASHMQTGASKKIEKIIISTLIQTI